MKKHLSIFVLCIALSGCGLAQRQAQMQAQKEKIAEYNSCHQYKRFVASAACTKRIADADTVLLPYNTDLQEMVALKEVLAEKVRAKKITEAEARLELTKRKNEMANQEAQTNAMKSSAAAAWAASSSIQQSTPTLQPMQQPMHFNCMNMGGGLTSCNGQ